MEKNALKISVTDNDETRCEFDPHMEQDTTVALIRGGLCSPSLRDCVLNAAAHLIAADRNRLSILREFSEAVFEAVPGQDAAEHRQPKARHNPTMN